MSKKVNKENTKFSGRITSPLVGYLVTVDQTACKDCKFKGSDPLTATICNIFPGGNKESKPICVYGKDAKPCLFYKKEK